MSSLSFGLNDFLLLLSFCLLSFCFGPLSPSYNSLNPLLITLVLYFFLSMFSTISIRNINVKWILNCFFLFFFWTLLLVNKMTTSFALLITLIYVLLLSGFYKYFINRKLIFITILSTSIVAVAFAIEYCFNSFSEFGHYLKIINEISSVSNIYYSHGFAYYLFDDAHNFISEFCSLQFLIPVILLFSLIKTNHKLIKFSCLFLFFCSLAYLQFYKNIDSDVYHRNYIIVIFFSFNFSFLFK